MLTLQSCNLNLKMWIKSIGLSRLALTLHRQESSWVQFLTKFAHRGLRVQGGRRSNLHFAKHLEEARQGIHPGLLLIALEWSSF